MVTSHAHDGMRSTRTGLPRANTVAPAPRAERHSSSSKRCLSTQSPSCWPLAPYTLQQRFLAAPHRENARARAAARTFASSSRHTQRVQHRPYAPGKVLPRPDAVGSHRAPPTPPTRRRARRESRRRSRPARLRPRESRPMAMTSGARSMPALFLLLEHIPRIPPYEAQRLPVLLHELHLVLGRGVFGRIGGGVEGGIGQDRLSRPAWRRRRLRRGKPPSRSPGPDAEWVYCA